MSSEKSHVGMLHRVCPVCLKTVNTHVLLDRRLKQSLERDNYTLSEKLCDSCQAACDDGYIHMIECIDPVAQVRVKLSEANRTGRLFSMHRTVFNEMFENKTELPFVMITKDLGDIFQSKVDEIEDQNNKATP